jgi:hypothetical protein
MFPRKISKDKVVNINPYYIMETVKMTVYSADFQKYIKEHMEKTGKKELSSSEILDLYSKFLKA